MAEYRSYAYRAGERQIIPRSSAHPGSYATQMRRLLGGVSPNTRGRMNSQYGRSLTGLSGESTTGQVGYDAYYQDDHGYELEAQDDVYGSGIFDPAGRGPTANADMGVLSSDYSLPGYLAREVPFTVSREITDITQDAEVVRIPGGGLYAAEKKGKLTRPAVTGPTWQPKAITPAGVTARDQPYAFLNRPEQPGSPPLNPTAPVTGPPGNEPPRNPTHFSRPLQQDRSTCQLPRVPSGDDLPRRMTVQPSRRGIEVPPYKPACPPSSLGQEGEKEGATAGQLVVAGAIVGAAAGIAMAVVGDRKKGKR